MHTPSRRELLRSGLGAFILGYAARSGLAGTNWPGQNGTGTGWPPCLPSGARPIKHTDPFLELPEAPESRMIGEFPFHPWWTGDDWADDAMPFHGKPEPGPPVPDEEISVAVIGGGISGLSTGYLLRDLHPVVFELRDRFGGNAQAETWSKSDYSLGTAYVIAPDKGSFLEQLYTELGLDKVQRTSIGDDPVELKGVIRKDFWTGAGFSKEEQFAFQRYAEVVTYMAEKSYPEIPLPEGKDNQWIRDLDQISFLQDVEAKMGVPMTPLLKAGVQGYFYSSFGFGMEAISAASGWNFVAAEEYGRWVFPGGVGYIARELWRGLLGREGDAPPGCRPYHLRAGCRVLDVRLTPDKVLVTYRDPQGLMRSALADQVVMANSKHIAKHMLHDLETIDPEKLAAMSGLANTAYIVVNVLVDGVAPRDLYDVFLLEDGVNFPVDGTSIAERHRVIDVINGDYARRGEFTRGVLTMYWPLPTHFSHFPLITNDSFNTHANRLLPKLRDALQLFQIPSSAVRQVRMTRWGHAMPSSHLGLIGSGLCEMAARPIQDRIYFVNQDNWALPAVENCLLDAQHVTQQILARRRR